MSVFVLKIIAIICMLFDHSSFLKYGEYFSYLRCIGRISFPIFAFLIAEGYAHTKNVNKYYTRLIIFALISQIPFGLFHVTFGLSYGLNIGCTLLLGLISIDMYEKLNRSLKKKERKTIRGLGMIISSYLVLIFLAYTSAGLKCDYGAYGVLLIFLFYVFRKKKLYRNISVILLMLINYVPGIIQDINPLHKSIYLLFVLSSLIIINLYNGKKGNSMKWLFYLVYPIHLFIIYIVDLLIK